MGYLRQVCSHWLSVITQVTGKNKRPEEPSAIEEPSESPSWLVLNLFKPKAIELNKDQPEPSLILTRNCSPQPAFNFKCFKTFGTSPVVRIWHSYIKKKKKEENSPGILDIVLLHQRMRRTNWLNYPRKKSCLLRASVGNISQKLAPEHRCRVSETHNIRATLIPPATKITD